MTTEQKVLTVNNTDAEINTEIATQNASGWIVMSVTLWNDDSTVMILFTKIT